MRRAAPAIVLFFLAPLIAEYLLGDFTLATLFALFLLAPMYGSGAVLIREFVRRTGRGWPSMLLLALAYGVFEEGVTTQSLFDPDYAGAHLLDHGFVPALGIAIPWTLFVLTLHTVWSISTPIALVESASARPAEPWLRRGGLITLSVLFVIGSAGTTAGSIATDHFVASPATFAVVAAVIAALVTAALLVPKTRVPRPGAAPSPWLVGGLALAAGALFIEADHLPTALGVTALLVATLVPLVLVLTWSARTGWGVRHRFALAAAATLTYAWHGFLAHPVETAGHLDTQVSHVVFAAAAVAGLLWAARRRTHQPTQPVPVDNQPVRSDGPPAPALRQVCPTGVVSDH